MTDLLAWDQHGTFHIGTPADLTNELVYCAYRAARRRQPNHPPASWEIVFPDWQHLEVRYQQEFLHGQRHTDS